MSTYKISYTPYTFNFNFPGGTSRGVLTHKQSWFIKISHTSNLQVKGYGEVSILNGLSPETSEIVEKTLKSIVQNPDNYLNNPTETLKGFPAIRFGLECALIDLQNGGKQILYPSNFTNGTDGIRINGLIWMGDHTLMLQRIKEKLDLGFSCLKLKVGAIDFEAELNLLKHIRKSFSPETLELRVDANGAFASNDALAKIEHLSAFKIHSIEQPIKQGQWKKMATLCNETSIPIALDEELIGIEEEQFQEEMLETIKPQYIICKPSLVGGLEATKLWGILAKKHHIDWWVTSALEGNIGLNAIAQWTYLNGSKMPQGLGTGQIFSNNINSPLYTRGESLHYNPNQKFDFNF